MSARVKNGRGWSCRLQIIALDYSLHALEFTHLHRHIIFSVYIIHCGNVDSSFCSFFNYFLLKVAHLKII